LQFYSCAVFGKPLSKELTGNGPDPIGCERAKLTEYYNIARSVANDEINHVGFLRAALGADAVQCPQVDIGPAFAAAADAAAGAKLNPPFTPYANDLFFLHGSFIFEDVGVTAYKGGVAILQGGPTAYLEAAAGILGVEAYHAGSVRTLLLQQSSTKLPYGVTVGEFIGKISYLRDALDGPMEEDKGIVSLWKKGQAILAPTDTHSVAFQRTPAQVCAEPAHHLAVQGAAPRRRPAPRPPRRCPSPRTRSRCR
jgi:hypothetical protein